jgi:uroporphyrinogen decarboxylase
MVLQGDRMERISSLDRVTAALEHREADRVPFDLGGSVVTGMNRHAYARLRQHLGLPDRPVEICHLTQQLARIDDDVVERLGADVRALDAGQPGRAPLATAIVREGEYDTFTSEWGIRYRMPVNGGFYYDMCGHPLAEAASVADIERFAWPDPLDPARFAPLRERADRILAERRPFVLGRCAAGTFELALWMRGFENFFMDLALNPAMAEALLTRITEIKMAYWERALEVLGEAVLIVSEADDLATQRSLMLSREMYRAFIFPQHKRLFDHIRRCARRRVYIFYHSCGAVRPMIPTLIEEGIDILNPVQVSAEGMDTAALKREFGRDLTFWGGGVDTQHVLPRGTPRQVREEVRRRVGDLAPGGGFVFATVHNVQADVPPENYVAMWEALREFGGY